MELMFTKSLRSRRCFVPRCQKLQTNWDVNSPWSMFSCNAVFTASLSYIVEASVFWAAMCCHRGVHHGHHQRSCFCVTLGVWHTTPTIQFVRSKRTPVARSSRHVWTVRFTSNCRRCTSWIHVDNPVERHEPHVSGVRLRPGRGPCAHGGRGFAAVLRAPYVAVVKKRLYFKNRTQRAESLACPNSPWNTQKQTQDETKEK